MHNCIFSAHCTELHCDKSCPTYVQTNYLLERNGIDIASPVFRRDEKSIQKSIDLLNSSSGRLVTVQTDNTVNTAELLTYCAICENWKGSQLHCDVYNLRFSRYLEILKQSWNTKVESDELEYTRIWANTCKVLILSNADYVNFGEFESHTVSPAD